jgi:hypothetical protein
LRRQGIFVLALGAMLPFLFVRIPPLTDIPGHIGAFAVQVAPSGSPLRQYFGFDWKLTLNMASELAIELLYRPLGLFGATWLLCAMVPTITVAGLLTVTRRLNPEAPASLPWALLFVYNIAFLTGFLNYALSAGMALCAFAAWMALGTRPWLRAALFLPLTPALLVGHAEGGALLVIWIASWELWRVDGWRPSQWRLARLGHVTSRLWPLATAVLPILASASGDGPTTFPVLRKFDEIISMLHDQNAVLDISTVIAALLVVVIGLRRGARFAHGSAGPVISTAILFFITPARLSGTDNVDLRLAPFAAMLTLALLDWNKVDPRLRRRVMVAGALLLATRLGITTVSFVGYQRNYDRELAALDHVRPGSRVLNLSSIDCGIAGWRSPRTEHLANLATPLRNAWTNAHWALPVIHMLQVRYVPGDYARDPSQLVRPSRCVDYRISFAGRERHDLAETMPRLPLAQVDYLWLVGLRLSAGPHDSRLVRIWENGNSELYEVR